MAIKIEPNVVFRIIPHEVIKMLSCILMAADFQDCDPTITGASDEHYPKGKVHDKGYAIDIRVSDIPDPKQYAEDIRECLRAVSPHYKVLYGDPEHLDHIHIGFAWYFARDNQRE